MANICSNELFVSGKEKEVQKFFKDNSNDEGNLSFETILPTPEKMLEGIEWYQWRLKKWGCKWDADVNWQDEYSVEFNTPWSPPIEWLEAVSKKYKSLDFTMKYDEGGARFVGVASSKNGKFNDNCINY